jgi:hypothetical protein
MRVLDVIKPLYEFALPKKGAELLNSLIKILELGDREDPIYQVALDVSNQVINYASSADQQQPDQQQPDQLAPEVQPVEQEPVASPEEQPLQENPELGDFNAPPPPRELLALKRLAKSPRAMEFLEHLYQSDPALAKELGQGQMRASAQDKRQATKDTNSRRDTEIALTLEYAQKVGQTIGMGNNESWTANLIGQLHRLKEKEKHIFLQACISGSALNWQGMLTSKQGMVHSFVDASIQPFWKKIESGIYFMPLAASVGGGQSGNGEAMIAMMVGGAKPDKGDIQVDGDKYEVKATQADISAKGTVSANDAWLEGDSTKASDVKRALVDWLTEKNYRKLITDKIIAAADFRPRGMDGMNYLLKQLPNRQSRIDLLLTIHAQVFPALAKRHPNHLRYFTAKMVKNVRSGDILDYEDVKKYQGGMAIFEYSYGKHGVKNFLFLSGLKGSTDVGFVITRGARDTVNTASTPGSPVQFSAGISFQGTGIKKASPGIKCYVVRDKNGEPDMITKKT